MKLSKLINNLLLIILGAHIVVMPVLGQKEEPKISPEEKTKIEDVRKAFVALEALSVEEKKVLEEGILGPAEKGKGIKLGDLPLPFAALPTSVRSVLENIILKNPKIKLSIPGFPKGFAISGDTILYGTDVSISLVLVKKTGGTGKLPNLGISAKIDLPKGWKFSDSFPKLTSLNKLKLPRSTFFVSTFDYTDPFSKAAIKKGLFFLSGVEFTGPAQKLNLLKKIVTFEDIGVFFYASIPQKITDAIFAIKIPARIGLDFEDMHKKGKLKKPPKFVRKITTGGLIVAVTPAPLKLKVKTSIILWLTTQEKPLEFSGEVELDVEEATVAGRMEEEMFDPAFGLSWLALGDFGLKVFLNYEVLTATGLPSGIAFHGKMGIGKAVPKPTASVIALAKVTPERIGEFLFDGHIEKIRLTEFVHFLSKAVKKEIPIAKLPPIELIDLDLKLALTNVKIKEKEYKAGIEVSGGLRVGDKKGTVTVNFTPGEKKVGGKGYLSNIETKYFSLTGPGPDNKYGTKDDGLIVDLMISSEMQYFKVAGKIAIPVLKLTAQAVVGLAKDRIQTDIRTTIGGIFTVKGILNINPTNLKDFMFEGSFERDFHDITMADIKKRIAEFKGKSEQDIASLDAKIKNYEDRIKKAEETVKTGIYAEVAKTDVKIKGINTKIAQWEKEIAQWKKERENLGCKGLKALRPVCSSREAKIIANQTKITEKKGEKVILKRTYKNFILKVGSKTADMVLKAVEGFPAEIDKLVNLKKIAQTGLRAVSKLAEYIAQGLFLIKEASIKTSSQELEKKKLPQVVIVLQVGNKTLNLSLQFDKNNPKAIFKQLWDKVVNSVKAELKKVGLVK